MVEDRKTQRAQRCDDSAVASVTVVCLVCTTIRV